MTRTAPPTVKVRTDAHHDLDSSTEVRVLIVDDNTSNLISLEATLSDLPVVVVPALSGEEALRRLLNDDFALILLDVMMPGMDGFETAAYIRQRDRTQRTPIIFLTAFGTDDIQIFKGYSLGAVDYLAKPIDPRVLRSKVSVFVDIYRKTEEVKRQADLLRRLEQREHERQLADMHRQMEADRLGEEMRIAREIQQKLFPVAVLPVPGFDISGASHPAEATGGDYFDYVPMRDGSLGIVVGDVSGHGYGPALLMAQTRAYLRAFLLTHTDIQEIIALVNRALAADTPDGRFTTLMFARVDARDRSFEYVSAGHVTGYVLDAAGEVRSRLTSTGMPLGIAADGEFEAAPRIVLERGETVLMLTDGVADSYSADDRPFGIGRTLDIVRANRQRPAREAVASLFQAVRDFCGSKSQLDDMTAVVIKVDAG